MNARTRTTLIATLLAALPAGANAGSTTGRLRTATAASGTAR